MGPKFPWTPALEHLLVSMVLTKGGHIAERSKSSEIWKDIYQTLFEQDLFAPLKEHYYDLKECGGIRVFKTKFTSLQDDIQRMMESGNKSKYGGELSSIFSNMKVIREERLQMEHQKSLSREEKEASKQKMEELEAQILNKTSYRKF